MAMPMLAGPGSISLLIGLYAQHTAWSDRFLIAGVIVVTGLIIYAILRSSPYLYKALGEAGIKAMTRIMGFLVMAIGIQYIMVGVVDLVQILTT
jgi:multiple antibiotic resistance protein